MNASKNQAVIATLTRHAKKVCAMVSRGGAFTVWVFGGDAKLRLNLSSMLPLNATLGVLGTRLDEAADTVERELLDLDQQVLSEEKDRLAWCASLIGDRSPYAGDLQLNTARYIVMDGIVRAGGRHLFFVENDIIAQALVRAAQTNALHVSWHGGQRRASSFMKTVRAKMSALRTHWRQSSVLKKMRRTRPAPWGKLEECDVLLIDWAGVNGFDPVHHTGRTHNLVRMAEILRKAGLKVGFIANALSWTQPYEAIAANVTAAFDPVVLIDECRSMGSVVRGAWATWGMLRRLKFNFRAAGHDLSALFELECNKDKIYPQSTLAYTLADVARTLATHKVMPKAIVYPFENQGWERALIVGMRRHLPNTRLIAYQHSPFAARYIGIFPPRNDINVDRLPDRFVVMGPHYVKLFADHGWPWKRLVLGGSVRFEAALADPPQPVRGGIKTVLAVPSIDFAEALDLVVKVGTAIKFVPGAHLVVNFHPVVDQAFRDDLVEAVGKDIMEKAKVSYARAADLIAGADVLVYNSSGAVFDACFAGVPAVHVAVDGCLSYDKVPGTISRRVYTVDDLTDVLRELLSKRQNVAPDLSVGGVVGPVDEGAIVSAVRGA